MVNRSLLQGIFPTQGSNSGLPHCRQILYQLSHEGSRITELLIFSCAHLWCANNIICWGQSRKTRGTEHHVNGSVNSKCQLLLMQRTGLLLLLLLSCFSRVWLCVTPSTAAYQASLSMGFSRQEHWSGLPFPSPMHESEKLKWSRSVLSDSSDPMDCSLPGSSVHGIFQARVLE